MAAAFNKDDRETDLLLVQLTVSAPQTNEKALRTHQGKDSFPCWKCEGLSHTVTNWRVTGDVTAFECQSADQRYANSVVVMV